MRLCYKCIALYRDAGYSVTEDPLSFAMEMILKPCPFCGGKAELCHDGKPAIISFVACSSCGIRTLGYRVRPELSSDEVAIKAWNRRTDDDKR